MLKIGLIGFGAWVRSAHLPALQRDGRGRVVAVAAASEKTREYARSVLGEEIAVFESWDELLCKAQVDAVMVAVPDELHQAALTAALEAGVPVFYEPPVSHRREQIPVVLQKLLTAKQVTFAHIELCYHPIIARAAELIRGGEIGLLQSAVITLNANWGCTKESDICLLDRMSCWNVDVLNHIAGGLPERVMVLDGHGGSGRMQSASIGVYDYGGVWGIIKADLHRPDGVSIQIEITGSEGNIQLDYFTGVLRRQSLKHPEPVHETVLPLQPFADYPAVRETVTAFLDAVESGNREKGNARAVAALNLIGLAVEESKDTGNWAEVRKLENYSF